MALAAPRDLRSDGLAMGKPLDRIDPKLRAWIAKQALFFVATAPGGKGGHVNLSPKGPIGSLRVLDDTTVAYLDVVGSGAETIAHLKDNRRIVLMLCAFEGPPRILRIHGKGRVVFPRAREFDELLARARFVDPGLPAARRAIIVVSVERVADSCGYGVPLLQFEGLRPQMAAWAKKKVADGPDAILEYQRRKNTVSIDGMPAIAPRALTPAGGGRSPARRSSSRSRPRRPRRGAGG